MKGRKPIPIENLKRKGTYRADRHGDRIVPSPTERGIPDCPTWMSDRGRSAWVEIAPMLDARGVLTRADSVALQAICERYADWREYRELVRSEGSTYETRTQSGDTMIRPHPAVAMRDEAERSLRSWLTEFGLTPSSRSKVTALATEKETAEQNPLKAFLSRKA